MKVFAFLSHWVFVYLSCTWNVKVFNFDANSNLYDYAKYVLWVMKCWIFTLKIHFESKMLNPRSSLIRAKNIEKLEPGLMWRKKS